MLPPTVSHLVYLSVKPTFLLLSHSCGFIDMGCPLWWENGSVIYNFCWPSPAQSFLGLSPARLMTIFYCLRFDTPPNLKGQVPVFTSPWNRMAQLYPQALGFLRVASYNSQGYSEGIQTCLHKSSLLVAAYLIFWERPANTQWTPYVASGQTAQTAPLTTLLLLYYIAISTNCAENTTSKLLHCCMLQSCRLATGVFTKPFPSNGYLCWLHSSCLEQICKIATSKIKTMEYIENSHIRLKILVRKKKKKYPNLYF
jgi:hypothetical protein